MMQRYFLHLSSFFFDMSDNFGRQLEAQIGKEQRRVHQGHILENICISTCISRTQIAEEVPSHSRRTRENHNHCVFHLPPQISEISHRQGELWNVIGAATDTWLAVYSIKWYSCRSSVEDSWFIKPLGPQKEQVRWVRLQGEKTFLEIQMRNSIVRCRTCRLWRRQGREPCCLTCRKRLILYTDINGYTMM